MKKNIIYILVVGLVLLVLAAVAVLSPKVADYHEDGMPAACNMIFDVKCQDYLIKITKQKKFVEALRIQRKRAFETLKIINANKNKVKNKTWLTLDSEKLDEEYAKLKKIKEQKLKNKEIEAYDKDGTPLFDDFEKDYSLLIDNNYSLRDFLLDSLIIAAIESKELKNDSAALEAVQNAKKVLNDNKYYNYYDQHLGVLDRNIKKYSTKKAD